MAFVPTKKKFSFSVPVFDGGLNTKYVDLNTPINQTPNCQNVFFDDFGAVGTAFGYAKLNSTAIGSFAIDGLREYFDNDRNRRLIAACGGNLYQWGSSTFTVITDAESLTTAGQDVFLETINDYAYVSNGYINPYKWDGTTFSRIGVSNVAADACSGTSLGITGVPNGTYRYALTGVNSANVQGDYAIVTTYLTATSDKIIVSPLPTFPTSFAVNDIYLYRNTAGASNVFYRVTSITNGALASYTDNAADADLVTEAPSDNGVPAQVKVIIEHRNRAFGWGDPSNPMRLYWSTAGAMETWPSVNFKDIDTGDGLPIVGGAVFGNALFLHKNDGKGHGTIWLVYMPDSFDVTDDTNWYFDEVAVKEAGTGQKTIVFYNKIQTYINHFGVFGLAGTEQAKSPAYSAVGVFPVDALSFLIEPTVKNFQVALLDKAAAVNYDNKLWWAVPKNSISNYNDSIYVFDYVRASSPDTISGAWSLLTNPPVNCFSYYDGDLYGGSAKADGFVYKLNTGRTHAGGAIESYFTTVWIAGRPEHQDNTKTWRFLYLWYETSGTWNLTVDWWLDFESSSPSTTTVSLASGGDTWDESFIWGTSLWGGGNNTKMVRVVLEDQNNGRAAKGRVIQFRFKTNTVDQHFKLLKMQLDYNLGRIRY